MKRTTKMNCPVCKKTMKDIDYKSLEKGYWLYSCEEHGNFDVCRGCEKAIKFDKKNVYPHNTATLVLCPSCLNKKEWQGVLFAKEIIKKGTKESFMEIERLYNLNEQNKGRMQELSKEITSSFEETDKIKKELREAKKKMENAVAILKLREAEIRIIKGEGNAVEAMDGSGFVYPFITLKENR